MSDKLTSKNKQEGYTKYLIIGAGISGLTFANYVGNDYMIVEKEKEIGGYCRTIKRNGFVWDYAGHFFHFSSDEFKKKFIESVPESDIKYKVKDTKIMYKDYLVDYPFQTNIHQLEKEEFIDCLYDLFHKTEKEEYDNFLEMLYGKFGRSIVEKFLKPYNEKLYAVDLRKLDTNAMGRFFPYADINAIIDNMRKNKDTSSYNNTFLYPINGAGYFMNILYDNLDKSRVFLETSVVSIDEDKKIAQLSDGRRVSYEYLINTAPLNQLMGFFRSNKYDELKNKLSYNQVLVFNLGFNKKSNFSNEHWMYVPSKEINFYRIGFYDNILDSDKLSMYIEIGYDKDEKIDVESQLEKTLTNLKKLKVIDETFLLEDYEPIIMSPAYVHINAEHEIEIANFKDTIRENGIYTIGRYGAWTYCSMEDCMIEAKELARILCEA